MQSEKVLADFYPVVRFVPRQLQVVPSRQFRRDRWVRNRVSLNNSRSIRRRSFFSANGSGPVLWTRDNNDNAVSSRPLLTHVQFSHFLHSLLLFRGNRDCALQLFDLSIGRSLAPRWPTTTNDTRVHTRYTEYRDRRKRRRTRHLVFFLILLYSRLSSR